MWSANNNSTFGAITGNISRTAELILALCVGNPPVTGGFPSKTVSKAEIIFMSWSLHDTRPEWRNKYQLKTSVIQVRYTLHRFPKFLVKTSRELVQANLARCYYRICFATRLTSAATDTIEISIYIREKICKHYSWRKYHHCCHGIIMKIVLKTHFHTRTPFTDTD